MPSGYLSEVTFLVVDANPFMRSIVRRVLKSFDAKDVREAEDGADAMSMISMGNFKPDIVITDWVMEPINGIDLCRWLRTGADSPDPYIPIIMMSAHSEQGKVTDARDIGVNEFLVKPISARSILKRIRVIIERPRAFIRTAKYFGPDRRRVDRPFHGQEQRSDYEAKSESQLAEAQQTGQAQKGKPTDSA